MDDKQLFQATSWLEQPPSWADPDHVSEETARANAAAFMAAAAGKIDGVRTSM